MAKSKSYLKTDVKMRVSREADLTEIAPSVHTVYGQTYGVVLIRLEGCPACKRWCVDTKNADSFPFLSEYSLDAQIKRNGWAVQSKVYSERFKGWLCVECDHKYNGHTCKSCKNARA